MKIFGVEVQEVRNFSDNQDFAVSPFPQDEERTAVAVAYKNEEYVADKISPRLIVGKPEFKYQKFTEKEPFTIPNTVSSRKGSINEVEFTGTEVDASTQDYGLMANIPQQDIDGAYAGVDVINHYVEGLMDLILLDREKRIADQVFAAANYATANKATLSGNDQFSDFANSKPITKIKEAIKACLMKPNKMLLGYDTFHYLSSHPEIIGAYYKNSGTKGNVTDLSWLAGLFGLDEVIVGGSFYNSANEGQSASYARVFGKHLALFYSKNSPLPRFNTSMFFTGQYGSRLVYTRPLAPGQLGLRGGVQVLVGESVKEIITADNLGYLFTNAVA